MGKIKCWHVEEDGRHYLTVGAQAPWMNRIWIRTNEKVAQWFKNRFSGVKPRA